MFLSKLVLNERNRQVQYDLGNAHRLHQQIMHAFPDEADRHPEGDWNPRQAWNILFRQEPEPQSAVILVQSDIEPNWSILPERYLDDRLDRPVDQKPFVLTSEILEQRRIFQFRLKANPSKRDKKTGKTVGFLKPEDQFNWLKKQGDRSGFNPQNVLVNPAPDIFGKKEGAKPIRIKTVLYQGILEVTDSTAFLSALQQGIGRGKSYGCGLLSIAKYG